MSTSLARTIRRSNATAAAMQPVRVVAETIMGLEDKLAETRAFWEDSMRDALRDKQQVIDRLERDATGARAVTIAMAAALEGVLNSACHPDIALRAVLVPLDPVREALSQYRRFVEPLPSANADREAKGRP